MPMYQIHFQAPPSMAKTVSITLASLDLFLVDKLHVSRIPVICVIRPLDSFIKVVHLASGWTFSFN